MMRKIMKKKKIKKEDAKKEEKTGEEKVDAHVNFDWQKSITKDVEAELLHFSNFQGEVKIDLT